MLVSIDAKSKIIDFETNVFSIFETNLFFQKHTSVDEKFRIFFLIDRKNIFEEVEKNPDINIEVKFHCGSNGSTLSLWKWFQNHYNA